MRRKLNPLPETINGKRLVVVDDSIVRGTTQRSVVRMLREAGATEVHLRISSPPWRWPCFYGIDTPSTDELLAANHSIEEITEILGVDSLAYISVENLKAAIGADGGFCDACFTGNYPTTVPTSTPVMFTVPRSRWRIKLRSPGSDDVAGGARASGPAATGGATYAGAGVDIGAGDLAVEKMKGLVPGIGGFGAQFPFDTTRFSDPVLVSSTDGVGTKLTVAQATGRYGTVGIDLVAMCVDDLVCLGAEPLFMLDYIVNGQGGPGADRHRGAGHRGRVPQRRLRADRRRDGGTPRRDGTRRPRHRRLRCRRSGARADARPAVSWRATSSSGSRHPACVPTGTRWRATCCSNGPGGAWAIRPGKGPPTRWPTSCFALR